MASAHSESSIGALVPILQLHRQLAPIVQNSELGGIQQQAETRGRLERRLAFAAVYLQAGVRGEPSSLVFRRRFSPPGDRRDSLRAPRGSLSGLCLQRI